MKSVLVTVQTYIALSLFYYFYHENPNSMKTVLQKFIILLICFFSFSANAQSSGISINVLTPQGGLYPGNYYHLTIRFQNDTTINIDSVSFSYSLNGTLIGTSSYKNTLMPYVSIQITFPDSFMIIAGNNDLCIMVDSVNGLATFDTTCVNLYGITSAITPPYFDNFDGVNNGWFQTPSLINNSQWELGAPNFGATNSTHSGTNCWDLNLNSAYDSSAVTYLYSPAFDFINATNWKLSFWLNYNTEYSWDGTIMEYSTDGGINWTRLGTQGDINAVNWYTQDLIGSLNGWFGNSNGWKQSYYTLSQLNNAGWVQFRYKFVSDFSVNVDGISIDDFSIDTCTLGATASVTSNISCYGSCDGSLTSTVSGGVPPYNYAWGNGATTQTISSLCAGTYTLSVTDANGCTTQTGTYLTDPYSIDIIPRELFNCVTLYDSAYFQVTGGVPPYIFLWSNGNTTNNALGLPFGTYTITVTDATGCSATSSIAITGTPNVSYVSATQPYCNGGSGFIIPYSNGIPPLTYQWSDGSTTQYLSGYAGIYTVTITDALSCIYTMTDSIVDPPPINIIIDSVIASGCGSGNGSFYFSSNSPSFTQYINGVPFGSNTNLPKGVYSLFLYDGNCVSDTIQIFVPDSCIDVYPGDANYDLVADNKDLLQIGLAYGNTGPVRPAASNSWVAQSCPDWSNWFNIGINQKHADCDGNGLIDANDTIPVLLNYGLTHPLKPVIIPQVNTSAPDLYLVISQDTAGLSNLINVDVYCGTGLNPIDSIYGLAFSLHYDSVLTDALTASYDITNTFFGTPGVDVISIDKNFTSGYTDFGIVRTDHQNISGNGLVCRFSIYTTGSIAGNSDVLIFSLHNVFALTANENPIMLDAFGDSVFIDSTLNGINYLNWDAAVKVYPNPANNYFTVASSLTNISKILIINQLGEIVYNHQKPCMSQTINVATIPNGVYVLRIETKDGVMHRKIQIIR